MRNILILLLLALCIGMFGCGPDVKDDARLAEETGGDPVVEQPTVEIEPVKPEVKVKPVNVVDLKPETKPEAAPKETTVEIVTVADVKPVEETSPKTNDETVGEPEVTDTAEPEASKDKTPDSETETVRVDETTDKTKTTPPAEVKDDPKEKTPKEDVKQKRPKLVDTEFFKKCDYVLKNFVDKNGIVNYRKLRRKKRELLAAVKELGDIPAPIRLLWSKNDEKAFLLNAHNILTLKLIIDNYPIKANKFMSIWYPGIGIKHIPGARDKKYFRVTGLDYTLDEIEELLLKTAKDPKYCFAISYATMMGGKLRNEAYHPGKLDEQIDEQVKKYFADPKNLSIVASKKKIHISSIFKLENFKASFLDSRYAKIKRFREKAPDIKAFMNFIFLNIDAKKAKELESADYEIQFRTYDWLLNERSLK